MSRAPLRRSSRWTRNAWPSSTRVASLRRRIAEKSGRPDRRDAIDDTARPSDRYSTTMIVHKKHIRSRDGWRCSARKCPIALGAVQLLPRAPPAARVTRSSFAAPALSTHEQGVRTCAAGGQGRPRSSPCADIRRRDRVDSGTGSPPLRLRVARIRARARRRHAIFSSSVRLFIAGRRSRSPVRGTSTPRWPRLPWTPARSRPLSCGFPSEPPLGFARASDQMPRPRRRPSPSPPLPRSARWSELVLAAQSGPWACNPPI